MRILIVDDDPVHCRLLDGLLTRGGHEVRHAVNGVEALRALEAPDAAPLVIADWMMPEMDGIRLCRELRSRPRERYVYVILLTARDRHDDVVAGLDAGADDYLVKPVHHGELQARIRAACRILDLQEKLRVQALHDALTGLWNRRAILDALEREVDRSRRQGTPLSLLMIDLDHFKRINDTRGHLAGDDVLREAARRIAGSIRSYDAVGRYGGEEFLVIAPGSDGPQARDLAERIRLLFETTPIPAPGGSLPVTLSLGVVALACDRDVGTREALAAADAALYAAKNGGRNAVVLGALLSPGPAAQNVL